MQVEGGELQSALQYQVLSTGLQHGHLLVMVGGVQDQQWSMLLPEKQVSVMCIVKHECMLNLNSPSKYVPSGQQTSTKHIIQCLYRSSVQP